MDAPEVEGLIERYNEAWNRQDLAEIDSMHSRGSWRIVQPIEYDLDEMQR